MKINMLIEKDQTIKYYVDGKLHRLDGPAVIRPNGNNSWWHEGKLHRLDGPALDWGRDGIGFFIHGRKVTETAMIDYAKRIASIVERNIR